MACLFPALCLLVVALAALVGPVRDEPRTSDALRRAGDLRT